jgi:hypothetical protein
MPNILCLITDCVLEVKDAFDFSKALPVLHRVPKTESNFYKLFKAYINKRLFLNFII